VPSNTPAAETIVSELLTLRQAAELCGVSDRTLWGWATSGISPAPVRIGRGTVRYSRPEYLAWIAGGCKPMQGGPHE
jgi:predicted DNA-binding transcriptional regulator AlpA